MTTRRDFIKNSAMGGMAMSIPDKVISAFNIPAASKISLQKNDIILFQGDSITDAGRERNFSIRNFAQTMGRGYVIQAGGELLCRYPEQNLTILNKGVSGNKVFQLAERWDADCLDLRPNVVSILVGVNDLWHTKTHGYTGTVKTYEDDYRALLKRTVAAIPGVKLVIGEPYALRSIVNPVNFQGKPLEKGIDDSWYPEFDRYREVARQMAAEFNAAFVPYQQVYDEAIRHAPASYWSQDGIHPSVAGARLMAQAWLKAVKV